MKVAITTDKAPQAIGPYSQAIKTGDLIFFSGQIPLDPLTGELVGTDIEQQTRQVMHNMSGALSGAGVGFDSIVKSTIYLTDLGDFYTVNAIYAEYIGDPAPARACVEVKGLPRGALIEIEWIATAD